MDEIAQLRAEVERPRNELRLVKVFEERRADKAEAELERLMAAIKDAPHETLCSAAQDILRPKPHQFICDCWKSRALAPPRNAAAKEEG